jgi:hypothetical protein
LEFKFFFSIGFSTWTILLYEIIKKNKADRHFNRINTKNSKAEVRTITMDDDSSTMAKIKQETKQSIKKISDVNHAKKSLGKIDRQTDY